MKYIICWMIFSIVTGVSVKISAQNITYKDVEPIFFNKCASCHRAGDAAPFTLTSYEDISKRISFIKKVIEDNYMPPWNADDHYRAYANNRSLTVDEKAMILKWIERKAPKGNYNKNNTNLKRELFKTTAYNRKPDLTLKIDSSFLVKGDNIERFIIFKVPFEFSAEQHVEAIELYTDNKKIIHHINYGFYDVPDRTLDVYAGDAYINTTEDELANAKLSMQRVYKSNMVYYSGWIPGTSYEDYPADFGWILPQRGVMLLTVHYSAIAVDEQSVIGVNFFFKKSPVKREVKVISLGSGGIGEKDIFPKLLLMPNKQSIHHLRVKTQQDQSIMYVWPHMHYLGKEFYAYAVTPSLDTVNLVHIPKWDFRWQEMYKLKHLVKIPAGSTIHLDCTYDNTANNPFNPNSPPLPVFSFGDMSSKNEMMTLLLLYVSYKEGDEYLKLEN